LGHSVDQTDLVFGLWSEFISRSLHAGLQVSICNGYVCATLVNTHTDTRTQISLPIDLTGYTISSMVELKQTTYSNSSNSHSKIRKNNAMRTFG